ncbi:hypothetical protein KUCAC02_016890 [Chaenocephalus aceratus]|nr:hypothetical protein KUCAC02_016890 [Chaenocephalus aceratus]
MVVCTTYQVIDVLKECHDNLGSGGHAGRRRLTEKVSATYHGSTMREDVKNWVDESPRCQQHEVKHPYCIPFMVPRRGLPLVWIGPLPTTAKGKRYILTATDLFTKWVVATTLYHKTAAEVSKKIVNILLDFGLVEKITTDQGREFVNEVHRGVFDALGVKHCITSTYRPQCNGRDERTAERTRMTRTPEGISTSKQRSTKCTPYVAQFGRHPRVPMYQNIQIAQQRQNISYEKRKGQNVKYFLINVGDEVLRANKRKEGTAEPKLDSEGSVADHQYALSGVKYAKDLHPIQDKLLSYVHSTACLATLKALRGLLVTEASAKYSHRKRGIRAQETSRRLMSKNESKQDLCHLAKFKKSED